MCHVNNVAERHISAIISLFGRAKADWSFVDPS